jgi:hypothetical protein
MPISKPGHVLSLMDDTPPASAKKRVELDAYGSKIGATVVPFLLRWRYYLMFGSTTCATVRRRVRLCDDACDEVCNEGHVCLAAFC